MHNRTCLASPFHAGFAVVIKTCTGYAIIERKLKFKAGSAFCLVFSTDTSTSKLKLQKTRHLLMVFSRHLSQCIQHTYQVIHTPSTRLNLDPTGLSYIVMQYLYICISFCWVGIWWYMCLCYICEGPVCPLQLNGLGAIEKLENLQNMQFRLGAELKGSPKPWFFCGGALN